MSRFLMRDEDGNACERCGGSGMVRPNASNCSPSDVIECPDCAQDDESEDGA